MKIEDYSIVYTVVNGTDFYTSNNKSWLTNQLNILNIDLELLSPETFKDLFNSMYFPYLHIYKVYYGKNTNKEDQVELNRLKEEEKHRWLSKKYNETNEIIYITISKTIQTRFNQNLYNTVLYNQRQEELKLQLTLETKKLKHNLKELVQQQDYYNSLDNNITSAEHKLELLNKKLETIEQDIQSKIDSKKDTINNLDEKIKSKTIEYNNEVEKMRNDLKYKKQQAKQYIDNLEQHTSININNAKVQSNAYMYEELMKGFDNKLNFKQLLSHKEEILTLINN